MEKQNQKVCKFKTHLDNCKRTKKDSKIKGWGDECLKKINNLNK